MDRRVSWNSKSFRQCLITILCSFDFYVQSIPLNDDYGTHEKESLIYKPEITIFLKLKRLTKND